MSEAQQLEEPKNPPYKGIRFDILEPDEYFREKYPGTKALVRIVFPSAQVGENDSAICPLTTENCQEVISGLLLLIGR